MRPTIEALAHRLLDDLAATGPVVDLVAGYAMPLPFGVIGALLGVPTETQPRLRDGFRTLLQPWKGDPPPEAVAASDDIVATLTELVESHRQTPSDDLIGVLVTPAEDGERLSDQEILSSLFQLIVAGHDTTSSLIGSGVVALLDHPEQRRLLLESPEAIHAAVEELVRYTAPVPHATFRVTTEAVVLDGVEIPAHQQVLICLAGANRDPVVRADPHRLDVTRPPRHHLGFGHGIHHCLGAALARLEVEVAFEVLFGRHPNVRLAVERADLHWSHGDGLVLRGLAELPVRLAAA
jgi:cytochrome P450